MNLVRMMNSSRETSAAAVVVVAVVVVLPAVIDDDVAVVATYVDDIDVVAPDETAVVVVAVSFVVHVDDRPRRCQAEAYHDWDVRHEKGHEWEAVAVVTTGRDHLLLGVAGVVGVGCGVLTGTATVLWGQGNLHCLTDNAAVAAVVAAAVVVAAAAVAAVDATVVEYSFVGDDVSS